MKIRIGININKIEGPYGGGNQFANALEKHLLEQGHEVTRTLIPKLDLILIVSSQRHPKTTTFDIQDIQEYLSLNPKTAVIHRVNTLDEPRGVDLGINKAVIEANRFADYTVFVSSFVKDFFEKKGLDKRKPNLVILNGAEETIFNSRERIPWQPDEKMRIVTHHWSANYLKGFDIYERLDQLLGTEPFSSLFEFCFIGNLPLGLTLHHSRVIPPTWGKALGDLLRQQHIYVTAARLEASGQHHVEGMRCGLPVLYLNSGALPEYCSQYGVEFSLINFEEKLLEIRSKYHELYPIVKHCPYTGDWMSRNYEKIFLKIVAEKRAFEIKEPNMLHKAKIILLDRSIRHARKIKPFLSKAWHAYHR
jgi:hypothetical protein